MNPTLSDIPNARLIGNQIVTGGQPSHATLDELCQAGCCTVVNLRPAGELGAFDEAATVTSYGMRYVHIPVGGPSDLCAENARRLHDALDVDDDALVLVHCASGNRVGALMALRAHVVEGKAATEAVEIGLQAGLDPNGPLYQLICRQLG